MIASALQFSFFREALIAVALVSIACGVMGTFVVVKRISSISGGLSHAALGGVGLGYLLSFEPLVGAGLFAVVSGAIMGVVYRYRQDSLDTLISMLWSVGMAFGIVCIALTPGYAPDITSYLFGNVLFVSGQYLLIVGALDLLILLVVALFFEQFRAVCFDEEFSQVVGVRVDLVFLGLITLVALSVVVLIKVVGVILTISLLTIPAVIARHWSGNLRRMMVLAVGICAACGVSGLFLSYWVGVELGARIPTGPLIILVAIAAYLLSLAAKMRR